ncbi:MAG: hypothetical protein ACJA1R_002767, partial [Flavobacteriales bacterium]
GGERVGRGLALQRDVGRRESKRTTSRTGIADSG